MLQVNRPMLDYLRLTLFATQQPKEWTTLFAHVDTPAADSRFLQYRGLRAGGLFVGDARQREKRHWLLDISGSLADTLFRRCRTDGAKCTRIDLQVTIPLPPVFDTRSLYDSLVDAGWSGRKRRLAIVQSGDGLDTIYIGSRTSERFYRIYVKEDGEGERLIRFEVEYKGALAKDVWREVDYMPGRVGAMLAAEIDSLPELKFGLSKLFAGTCGYQGSRPKVETRENGGKTWRWMRGDVSKSVRRLLADHDMGEQMRKLLDQWQDFRQELDDARGEY